MSDDDEGEGDKDRAQRVRDRRSRRDRRDRREPDGDMSESDEQESDTSQTSVSSQTAQTDQLSQTEQTDGNSESQTEQSSQTTQIEQTDQSQSADTTSQMSQTQSDTTDEQPLNEQPIKERTHETFYLRDDLRRELRRVTGQANLDFEMAFDTELEKNRHLRPLLLYLGAKELEAMEPAEIKDTLLETDLLDNVDID